MRALQLLVVFSLVLATYSQAIPQCTADSSCGVCNCGPDMGCAGDVDVCSLCDFSVPQLCAQITDRTARITQSRPCYIVPAGVVTSLTINTGLPVCLLIEDGATVRRLNLAAGNSPSCVMNNGVISGTTNLGDQDDCMFVGTTGSARTVNLGGGTNTFTVLGGRMTSGRINGGDGSECIKGLYDMVGMSGSSIREVRMGLGGGCYFGQQDSRVGRISGEGDLSHFIGLTDGAQMQGCSFTGNSNDGLSVIGSTVDPTQAIMMGPGDDNVYVENSELRVDLDLGSGNDNAVIGCSRAQSIMGQAGDDCIDLFSSTSDPQTGVMGGGEVDTIIVSDSSVGMIEGGDGADRLYNCNNRLPGGLNFAPAVDGGADMDLCTVDNGATVVNCEDTSNMPPCPPPPVMMP